jgi:hypothetical protein
MQSARSPSLLARACGLKMAVAVKSSGSFLALRSARLLATSRSLPGRRPYRHGPASQDEFRSRELRQPCMALRSARPLAKARSLPGSPSLPARALCRFYMLTRTGRASTGSLPRAVPEPPSPRSLPGRRPYRHGPASQDEFRSRELRQPCMALRSARPLAKARSLPGSPPLPARALCRFYMLTRTAGL